MQGIARSERPAKNQNVASNSADRLFALGVKYSTDFLNSHDLVMAHMCFNLAASKGHQAAIERRLEVAAEMSKTEISAAQRAARISLAVQQ
jgi:TPR repeat protein